MTIQDFQKTYSDQLKTFFNTPCGQNFLGVLNSMRPAYEFSVQQHLLAENRGAIRGYEQCIRNAAKLCIPYTAQTDPEPNYGVPSKQ